MQIRLTVFAPRSGQSAASAASSAAPSASPSPSPSPASSPVPPAATAGRACDVLVTAPAGTPLAAVASGLASAVCGPEAPGSTVLYAGGERLDAHRRVLGEPPLIDGAVLRLQSPGEDETVSADASARFQQLHVVAGPDAGGVHLLHGGRISIGRSADADVALNDPDVSRLHCAVTVDGDGRVTVEDLGSTNGTTLDGVPVGPSPVSLPAGSLLRAGESTLRLAPPTGTPPLPTASDGEGRLRVRTGSAGSAGTVDRPAGGEADGGAAGPRAASAPHGSGQAPAPAAAPPHGRVPGQARGESSETLYAYGDDAPPAHEQTAPEQAVPERAPHQRWSAHDRGGHRAAAPEHASHDPATAESALQQQRAGDQERAGHEQSGHRPAASEHAPRDAATPEQAPRGQRAGQGQGADRGQDGRPQATPEHAAHEPAAAGRPPHEQRADRKQGRQRPVAPQHAPHEPGAPEATVHERGPEQSPHALGDAPDAPGTPDAPRAHSRRQATPPRGTRLPAASGPARRRGIGAWARRLTGARNEPARARPQQAEPPAAPSAPAVERWPDPAAVLLAALGPGPRLWERDAGHPEAMVLRLGTADRAELPSVPVTVSLREAGSLGLAGPRARLSGLARWVLAQLAALHPPTDLEIVLISADRARSLQERRAEWAWLGWLPQLQPGHGQDCRLLLAYDREQAAARAAELTRRLDEGPLGPAWASADRQAVAEAAARHTGPRTVVVVDGDPGTAALRETAARLAAAGAAAGIHLVTLAETAAASPASPVAVTYESACALSRPFRECGAVGLLSGDVATALRVMRTAGGQPAGHGTVGTVDAVSPAWAERFARALAPLRTEGAAVRPGRAAPLPRSARLLDELGLARATPASLLARWAAATHPGGDATAVLGAGPHGPLAVDLTAEGPHLLIEGPAGSGRTELLRSLAASLAAGDRPDRLALLLVDGAGAGAGGVSGGAPGAGLAACAELPHVTDHLSASDPLRMRAFAQALGAELKRRAELLDGVPFTDWQIRNARAERGGQKDGTSARQEAAERLAGRRRAAEPPAARHTVPHQADAPPESPPKPPSEAAPTEAAPTGAAASGAAPSASSEAPGGAADTRGAATPPPIAPQPDASGAPHPPRLPRLIVLVDDFDALVAPSLGSAGRPAAGSVVRALEAVARDGERLGVHLVAASARPDRTEDTEPARAARLRVVLDPPPSPTGAGPDDPAPGRGRLGHPDGRVTPFQSGRVTGRIPRTATLRPTVVPLEWERMGDPPTRRPVRELGNGPTDLALLASALERAARSVAAAPATPLAPVNSP
ncbi:FHA domain-containing protein [Streptomyces sp. PR69]|uniref:FHA domain-containing protein n=1 Tax=Streptomyces sp. PR69 TaxID=2984950 RepID=UPI00226483DC|nr:FHA domain-containing protein [Streptomyces sp. PR69]